MLLAVLTVGLYQRPFFLVARDRIFFGWSLLLLFISRLPSILYAGELNTDESQMITHALTLLQNPVYWSSVDGTTIGPIDCYILMWPAAFGLPITYLTARLTGTLLIGLALWYLFAAWRLVVPPVSARLGLVLLVLFFSYTTHFDFLHYSSELVSLCLLAVSWHYLIHFWLRTDFSLFRHNWLIAGLLIGCVPFAKLQCVPPAALMAMGLVWALFRYNDFKWRAVDRQFWWLSAGFFLPAIFFVGICIYHGVLGRFYTFYIQANLFNYSELNRELYPATQWPTWKRLSRLPDFFRSEMTFFYFVLLSATLSMLAFAVLIVNRQRLSDIKQWVGFWSIAWLGFSLYSVVKPGTEFTHHLLILVLPLGWMIGIVVEKLVANQMICRLAVVPILFLGTNLLCWFNVFINYRYDPATAHHYLYALQNRAEYPKTAVSNILLKYARPNDCLVVWGWNLRYHVEAQLAQGTSENHSFRSILPHPLRQAYQQKYLEDITTNQPAFFIDATGPNSLFMNDTTMYRNERFAALGTYIAKRYRLVDTVDQVRIYLRNDRFTLDRPALPPVRPVTASQRF